LRLLLNGALLIHSKNFVMKKIMISTSLSVSLFLIVSSCKKDFTPKKALDQLSKTEKSSEKTGSSIAIVVRKGDSIQAAVKAAAPCAEIWPFHI
jgi:hypothetical protein